MAIRVNPKIIDDLAAYGAKDVQLCYHCGNCSAVCPHSDEFNVFPRKPMRNLQMGLEKKLERSLEPWLCYYCGQCSEQCPRGAEPGETMMSLRRWLTSRYDVTGLSKLFYRSWKAEMIAILLLALLTGVAFFLFGMLQGDIHIYSGPGAFLPSSAVHLFDWSMAGVLTVVLFANSLHMWRLTFGSNRRDETDPAHVPETSSSASLAFPDPESVPHLSGAQPALADTFAAGSELSDHAGPDHVFSPLHAVRA